jgi:hypothetical protein
VSVASNDLPTIYKDGQNFVVIAVGDPARTTYRAADGGCASDAGDTCGDGGDGTTFDTRSFHDLAFPTDPTILGYTP